MEKVARRNFLFLWLDISQGKYMIDTFVISKMRKSSLDVDQ